jgi:1,4-alpha-glucan branching enzyme
MIILTSNLLRLVNILIGFLRCNFLFLAVLVGVLIGYSEVWLNELNDYAVRHLHNIADKMCELAYNFSNETDELKISALNQCAREVLLAQSSDWNFIITNGTMVDYAKKRTKDHVGRFNKLYEQIKSGKIDEEFLKDISEKDAIFPDIDYRIYA